VWRAESLEKRMAGVQSAAAGLRASVPAPHPTTSSYNRALHPHLRPHLHLRPAAMHAEGQKLPIAVDALMRTPACSMKKTLVGEEPLVVLAGVLRESFAWP